MASSHVVFSGAEMVQRTIPTYDLKLKNLECSEEFLLALSRGRIDGMSIALFQGENPEIDLATVPEDIVAFGGTYQFQSTAQSLEVLSSSAADAAAGTGARTVVVTLLNSSYVTVSETVTLNGLTPVALSTQGIRCNGFRCDDVGSGAVNAGDVQLRVAGGGAIQAYIPAGKGRNQCGVFTVPAGYTGWLMDGDFSMASPGTNDGCQLEVMTRSGIGKSWLTRAQFVLSEAMVHINVRPRGFGPVGARGDIKMLVRSVSSNDVRVHGTLTMVLIQA